MKLSSKRSGFTLVEIMIVVAIIALLAAIAVPGFLRARKRAQGTTMKNDLRLIDAAKDQYAIEFNKANTTPLWDDLTPYFKAGTRLATSNTDLFGRSYTINNLSQPPQVNSSTQTDLTDILDSSFWSPFSN